ncbi:hypothetical protein [Streptomyces sp. NPDC091217]|uniref:hypothetical protein n=1 Tax=Streptomyces sp. NPDC091217 TaxID=3365975 RepID=UPI0038265CD8
MKPAWYQISTDDRMLHPDNQRRMAKRMNARQILELDSSHASPATRPGPIADLIEEAVGTTV